MSRLAVLVLAGCFLAVAFADDTGLTQHKKARDNKSVLTSIPGFIKWLYEKVIEALQNMSDTTDIEVWTCVLGIKAYVKGLRKGQIWALSMVDASAKLQSGFLVGNFADLGQFDQCVDIEPEEYSLKGMHCLTDLKITLPANFTIDIDGLTVPISALLGSNTLTLTMGQCFPSSCEPWILERSFNTILQGANMLMTGTKMEVAIDPNDCHLKERGNYSTTEWVVMIFILFFVFITSICTTADFFSLKNRIKNRQPYPGEHMILAFSAYTNLNKLISTKTSPDSITCINGLKALSISWVVLGHKYRYLMNQPITNLVSIPKEIKNWTKMFILSAPLSVDTFFMISGLLNMYAFCTIRAKKRKYTILDVIISYVHRFIRLTPSYAMMIAITATWLYRTGNGPVWDRVVGISSEQCRTDWWYNIAYLNNYINPNSYCMMQSWYLAADMQMYWLSPFVLYPLWRWPWFGYVEIVILVIASIASPFSISYFEEIVAPIPISTNATVQNFVMSEIYLPTHTKTVSYVIGILTGYLLYEMKQKKIQFKMNLLGGSVLWLLTIASMLYAVYGGYQIIQLDHPYNKIESAFYIGFYRFFWAIGLMWIIIACVNNYAGPINAFLSWNVFAPIGRLTYCIYLTHVAVILYGIGSIRSPNYYTDYAQIHGFFGDMFIVIICSTALSLLLESPLVTFEKIIFGGARTGNRARSRKTDVEATGSAGATGIHGGERLNY
ncbi:nose resistant to fluoxetine protein 6-like [Cimex lectularius]|uniref:Nose resistant-to-fluoxetine protein N-terminal domain-containing protein n=1 Tax=Cimex lectularius TaxID=79782 RepID=A0A8I6RDL9_CIMLE|nr:nose resistant to fluoxetine protein 6-like [Cimex lectularius]